MHVCMTFLFLNKKINIFLKPIWTDLSIFSDVVDITTSFISFAFKQVSTQLSSNDLLFFLSINLSVSNKSLPLIFIIPRAFLFLFKFS